MKKTLVVGLGNPLVREDSIGVSIVRELEQRPGLPDDIEILYAGTDLLRVADRLRHRELIVLVDAAAWDAPGDVTIIEHDSARLSDAQLHAHHLSAVQALDLIRWSDESVRRARCIWYLPHVNR